MLSFNDKVAWITGSSTGIGKAFAKAFSKHGAKVIIHCNNSINEARELEKEIELDGGKVLLVRGDVADGKIVSEMVLRIEKTFGHIDILINNAGSMERRARVEEMDEELWDKVINTNLKSVYLVSKAVLPLMKKQGKGKIINISSIAGRNGGGLGSIAYSTAKGGVNTLTRALAKDLAEYNILVNAIAPGLIATPFHDKATPPEVFKSIARSITLKRAGEPEDIVGAALFLASDFANYITGEVIEINGGLLMD